MPLVVLPWGFDLILYGAVSLSSSETDDLTFLPFDAPLESRRLRD